MDQFFTWLSSNPVATGVVLVSFIAMVIALIVTCFSHPVQGYRCTDRR